MKVDDLLSQVVRVVPAGDFGADVQLPVVSQHLLPEGRALAGELGKVMHPVENKAKKMFAALQSMMNAKLGPKKFIKTIPIIEHQNDL